MIRVNQKGPIETVKAERISVASNSKVCTEMSRSPGVIEARIEGLDEAGIT